MILKHCYIIYRGIMLDNSGTVRIDKIRECHGKTVKLDMFGNLLSGKLRFSLGKKHLATSYLF